MASHDNGSFIPYELRESFSYATHQAQRAWHLEMAFVRAVVEEFYARIQQILAAGVAAVTCTVTAIFMGCLGLAFFIYERSSSISMTEALLGVGGVLLFLAVVLYIALSILMAKTKSLMEAFTRHWESENR